MSSSAIPTPAAPSPSDEIAIEIPQLIRKYRSGTVERLFPSNPVPASLDPTSGVLSKDVAINPSTGLTARLYLPPSATSDMKQSVLIYYHGGGFCTLSASSSIFHNFLNSLVVKTNVLAVSVDYRLAPEHPIPAAYDDSWEAIRWVATSSEPWLLKFGNLEKIFLAGDSAGGNIVHNMGLKLGSEGMKVEGLALLHPYFWGKERIGEEVNDKDKFLNVKGIENLWSFVCLGTADLDDPKLNPTADGAPSLAGLGSGRVLVCVGEMDLLRDRGRVYYEKLKEIGWEGEAEFFESKGEDHGFFLLNPESEIVGEFVEVLVKFFNK